MRFLLEPQRSKLKTLLLIYQTQNPTFLQKLPMGRKRGGGGSSRKSHSNSDRILRRHIESAGKNYSSIDQLVDHLRSSYPHYARHKLRPFTKQVERIAMVSIRNNDGAEDSNDDGDTPILIKRRKVDNKEEKLQQIEAEHLRRRNVDVSNNGGGCSSSSLASAGSSDGGGSSDEEASTSDDAIYGEKLEPEFDLMKSMMREDLRRKSNKSGQGKAVNKEAVELEVVDNKGMKEVNMMNGESKSGDNLKKSYRKKLNKNDRHNSGGKDENVINGPMFKDLGGISGVIEGLKMEVIVPLLHPQLPRHLGVKPMAGILLHGPPGCGKTKLAHAIANETGVPFYKICATELVSGVSGIFFQIEFRDAIV